MFHSGFVFNDLKSAQLLTNYYAKYYYVLVVLIFLLNYKLLNG